MYEAGSEMSEGVQVVKVLESLIYMKTKQKVAKTWHYMDICMYD